MSPELQFLLRCVACAAGSQSTRPFASEPVMDGGRLRVLARRHRCSAMLLAAMDRISPGVCARPLMEQVAADVRADTVRAEFLGQRLQEVVGILKSHGIRTMLLKGPAVAALAYADPGLRAFDDLDVLVPPSEFMRAQQVMIAAGFIPMVDLEERDARDYMRLGWDRGFRSPSGDCCIELCCNVAPAYFSCDLAPAFLWDRPVRVMLSGGEIESPAPEPLLLLLSVHGAKHLWNRLVWTVDVAGLVRRHGADIDWDRCRREAARRGMTRMLELGLWLAGNVDEGCVKPANDERSFVAELGQHVLARWEEPVWREPSRRVELRFHLHVRERWCDRVAYVMRWAMVPGYGDWRWVRFPRGLRWMYYVTRPIRLAWKAMGRRH